MDIAIAQINPTLGDFKNNGDLMVASAEQAKARGAGLVVFPEMSLFGYHPGDLLERASIVDHQLEVREQLLEKLPHGIDCLVGCVEKNSGRGKPYFNSVVRIRDGEIRQTFHKQLLPVYDVFDESRHFHTGKIEDNIFQWNGKRVLLLICEDMWGWDPIHFENPIEHLSKDSVDVILNMSASPFTLGKPELRLKYARMTAKCLDAPLVYTNMLGGQDELIYDGGSFAINKDGVLCEQSSYFEEALTLISPEKLEPLTVKPEGENHQFKKLAMALALGLKDYVKKTGFSNVHLGLSGGIDSAVVACIACDALGAENVTCVAMPTQFNASKSQALAKALCDGLGCQFYELPIQGAYENLVEIFEKTFGEKAFGLMNENLQARLRGLLLMAYSNSNPSLLLSTGNKSEYATGYTTLYGDMCGALAVIGDLLKNEVYGVAELYGKDEGPMPRGIIERPPSAELRPDQKDADSLPSYDILDRAVEKLVCDKAPASSELENWVVNRLMISEFKRWQAPPILKVSAHAFGQGRRFPIAHKARV